MSRLAFDIMRERAMRAEEQLEQLTEVVTRLRRREAGMPELPREYATAPEPIDVPDELEELLAGFDSEQVRVGVRAQIRERLQQAPRQLRDRVAEQLRLELVRQLGPVGEDT